MKITATSTERSNFVKGQTVYCSTPTGSFLCIYDYTKNDRVHYIAYYNQSAGIFKTNDWCRSEYVKRKASQTEKSKLMNAIEKNGYTWQVASNTLTEKEDRTTVPHHIGIYHDAQSDTNQSGNNLFLGTENASHILYISQNGFMLLQNAEMAHLFVKTKCKLVPCNYQDLTFGDTAFRGGNYSDINKQPFYVKKLQNGYVYLRGDSAFGSFDTNFTWYKVVPA